MQKSHVLSGFTIVALAIWGIHNFDVNSPCYEIVEKVDLRIGSVLLDKCKGRTWTLVSDEQEYYEYDEAGNETEVSFETLVWTRIGRDNDGMLSFRDTEE